MLLAIPKQKNRLNSDYFLLSVLHWGPLCFDAIPPGTLVQYLFFFALHGCDETQSISISATTQMEHTLHTNKKKDVKKSGSKLPTAFHLLIKY